MTTERVAANRTELISSRALLTPTETAELLRVPVQLLYRWRYEGKGPLSFRIGRYVRYRRGDVDDWIDLQISAGSARPEVQGVRCETARDDVIIVSSASAIRSSASG